MHYQSVTCLLVLSLLSLLGGSASAWADDRNLIQTLYHSEFQAYADDGEPSFSLDGELGILAATGNTNASSVKAGVTSEHETRYWNNYYFAQLLYKQSEVERDGKDVREVTAQRFFGYAQFDYKLATPGSRLFMYGDYENDQFNGYNYRASLATGWSQRVWNDDESLFKYSIGPGYTFVSAEDGTVSNVNNGIVLRASAEYQYQWYTGAKFRQFISTEAGADNMKSRSETTMSANIFDSLAMKLSFVLSHETAPLQDVEGLNTETSVSIVYRFF
ncbi:DUF481 domain-containing protein [Alteromonas pelagimontana]|uniref:DUF481 domain-containing protein n=1 Tax=Alteromonas pelagimontana TaxID=1858656 RepID=A0A6M4MBT7_9ALTE|nr:DUF481 domain-containing protein [Alteromonas pelagimontana]QJR79995.1 DUF481 domain-containing protein [Alteromonas pelagimontana]